jgi:hypothetical protein
MIRKRVVFHPRFKRQLEKHEIRSTYDGEIRKKTAKDNTAAYFVSLCASLFGGKIIGYSHEETGADTQNGDPINFRPDIVRENKNEKIYTEVKSISVKFSTIFCALSQLEEYAYYVLKDALADRERLIEAEYAFCRYKQREKSPKLSMLTNDELTQELAERTKSLLVVPMNLAIALFLGCRKFEFNQSTSMTREERKPYWGVLGELVRELHHEPHKFLATFGSKSGFEREELYDLLLLDNLDFERYYVDGIRCREHRVSPFLVTRYFNSYPSKYKPRFQDVLRRHHERILVEHLGIRDRYQEAFDNEKERRAIQDEANRIYPEPVKPSPSGEGEVPF